MGFIISNEFRPLSYWYPNNNFYGKTKDIIGFNKNNYFVFGSINEAQNNIKKMFKDHTNMEGDLKLSIKIFNILEKLKIYEITKNEFKRVA